LARKAEHVAVWHLQNGAKLKLVKEIIERKGAMNPVQPIKLPL